MKIKVQIITGFLEWGKTTLINRILQEKIIDESKRTVIILFEEGIEELDIDELEKQNIIIKIIREKNQLDNNLFSSIKEDYYPDNILVEYNGTWEISDILRVSMPFDYSIGRIIFMLNGKDFIPYMNNMSNIISEQISNSDAVFINRYDELDKSKLESIKQIVKSINKKSKIILYGEDHTYEREYLSSLFSKSSIKPVDKILNCIIALVLGWVLSLYLSILNNTMTLSGVYKIQTINTIFLSILLQAIPFILIGVFVSSILQIFISDNKIVSLFSTRKWIRFPLSAILGIFFPVCDCGMVPITAGLVKKGVPLPQAITFMLASPAVNPIVIISTLYAFPDNPKIAIYRVVLGIIIAIITGIIIDIVCKKEDLKINNIQIPKACSSGYIGNIRNTRFIGKIEAVFMHSGMEFLNVARYIIVGALISSIIQTLVPKTMFTYTGTKSIFPLMLMLLASFLMSVCSNSNAFIAKSFSNTFPISSVLAFMIMGPMLDLKNLLMLSGSFKKRFIVILVAILLVVSVVLFSAITILI